MTLTYEQAIALLVNNPADYTTEAALLALTNQVSVETNGSDDLFGGTNSAVGKSVDGNQDILASGEGNDWLSNKNHRLMSLRNRINEHPLALC